jgi:hypothetical protein
MKMMSMMEVIDLTMRDWMAERKVGRQEPIERDDCKQAVFSEPLYYVSRVLVLSI